MTSNSAIKRTAITRAGYEYQDLVGIQILIDHFRDPDLYDWVQLESDDPAFQAIDDVVALRKEGSVEFVQVKFTVDAEQYPLDWDWLLASKGRGSSILSKWVQSFLRAKSFGRVHRARLVTNRIPSAEFAACMNGAHVDFDKIPEEIRARVESACGTRERAEEFFSEFAFSGEQPDLDHYEDNLRDLLVPHDTDSSGWLLLRQFVRRWAILKNDPPPDGKIRREHLVQLITKRRPQPIRQDFFVPFGYQVPSQAFDETVRARITNGDTPITILWGTPGRGKSTYLSHLTKELKRDGEVVLRHHYFLSSDGPRSNRMSYVDIAVSIIDQLISRYPDVAAGVTSDVEKLHGDLSVVAASLAEKGKRLFLIVDGLDHVWRDTSRTDQLDYLFNTLLPLPPNVSLIVGTQRVPDAQLPVRLLTTAEESDWLEVPRMDESAVHRWLVAQDEARPLILCERSHEERGEELARISAALFKVSQGHPLHLIYALESLVRSGRTISVEDIEALPACPDGDIRTYYKALWVRLSPTARSILHALAGSDFFWPSRGIRECFGDFSEVDFLLEPRNAGMIPFHQSIFAYVRELPEHADSYAALLPKIVDWLETKAPEYWRWGWLWIVQAESGNFGPLLDGTTRDWAIESLARGWSERQIARILAVAETRTFEQGDLPHTVSLRSMKTRVLNAREFQARDYGLFRAVALTVGDNRQQVLNLVDDLQDLSADEIVSLTKLCPATLRTEVSAASLKELGRRVNAWIELRHKPQHEFRDLSDHLLSAAAYAGPGAVSRTLRYLQGFPKPDQHCDHYIDELGTAGDIEALLAVRKRMRGQKYSHQRRLIQEHILRAALFKGANPGPLIKANDTDLTPFTACWVLREGVTVNARFHGYPPPGDLLGERYSVGSNPQLSRYFCDFFWSALAISLQAEGEFSIAYPSRDSEELGWLECGLACLEDVARGIAAGTHTASFSTIYQAADALESLDHVGPNNRDGAQFRAFRHCLPDLALGLHLLGLKPGQEAQIPASEFERARNTLHWRDEFWIADNMSNQLPLLDQKAADTFIGEASAALANRVSEFNERSDEWSQLSRLSLLYGVDDPAGLIRRAADCLVGYGWRKDLGATDVLDAIQQLDAIDPSRTKEWIYAVAPIIEEITDFTDGDETDHVRSELIEVVATTMPEHLIGFYAHHIANDEWRYADDALEAALRVIDLSSRQAAALTGTLLDGGSLAVLRERAKAEPIAGSLLTMQIEFLARSEPDEASAREASQDALRPEQEEALRKDPTQVEADNFKGVIDLISTSDFPYQHRAQFLTRWLDHWRSQGKASVALTSVREYFNNEDRTYDAEEILDHAFNVSLAEEGKDAAYPWLVKAHIYRHGWQSFWTSEGEVMARLTVAARTYPEKWRDFIRDTSEQTPYYRRRNHDFALGYKYLVRFLLLVGQKDIASAVADEFVNTLVVEVSDQPIPNAAWLRSSRDDGLVLELLFERLNWPVPMVRWRAAKEICRLLSEAEARAPTTSALLRRLEACETESETCSLLNIVFLTDPAARPPLKDIIERVERPSALSDSLIQKIFDREPDAVSWRSAHSGEAPVDFEPDQYFDEHKSAHVPAILSSNMSRLQAVTGRPFRRQWAFEWKQLRDRLKTRYTRYPYYFDDYSEVRSGIIGQYLQRQAEVYRSAYLRVLACATDLWGMPPGATVEWCTENVAAVAGLFDLEPSGRPLWLGDLPERALAADADLDEIARSLIRAGRSGTQRMVSLSTPFCAKHALYGDLSVAAFFVSDDFELDANRDLYVPTEIVNLQDGFSLGGQPLALTAEKSAQQGANGIAVPVCVSLLPLPFGYWQGDYLSVGLRVPASYCVPDDAVLNVTKAGLRVPASYCLPDDAVLSVTQASIELQSTGSSVASMCVWHDDWSPRYPRGGNTRCGSVTFLEATELAKAQAALGLRLAWCVERRIWERESDFGDFKLRKSRAIVIEP